MHSGARNQTSYSRAQVLIHYSNLLELWFPHLENRNNNGIYLLMCIEYIQ